jgi:hypothetical protein
MSKKNKVNPGQYTQAGRLTPDDAARERGKQDMNPVTAPGSPRRKGTTGISNRESGDEEHDERERLPSERPDRPGADDDTTDGGGLAENIENEQTSSKSGSRSGAQKAAEAKYVDRPHPASEKVDGAFGRESGD